MSIDITRRQFKRDQKGASTALTKAIAALAPSLILQDPLTAIKGGSSSMTNLIDAALAINKDTSDQIDYAAWDVARAAFAAALALFMKETKFNKPPNAVVLSDFISGLVEEYDDRLNSNGNNFNIDVLTYPLLLPAFRSASIEIPRQALAFDPEQKLGPLQIAFEKCLLQGIDIVRNTKPEIFTKLTAALTDGYAQIREKRKAQHAHEEFIIKMFAAKPIFGQEETGTSVSDLYVRQRGLWRIKKTPTKLEQSSRFEAVFDDDISCRHDKRKFVEVINVGDLHDTLFKWLTDNNGSDGIRVVAGGPGSGKSTFAKAFAVQVIDSAIYDVLLIPLQEISATGTFETRIESLFRVRTELGHERVPSPLTWLGQSQGGKSPYKPLLMICDGLDEIGPPDSAEAASVTVDFIQTLNTWVSGRNSGGCYVKALVLGRNIAAKEAFEKLSIDDEALITVAGLKPIENREFKYQREDSIKVNDPDELSSIDQRIAYWSKWADRFGLDRNDVPQGLLSTGPKHESLQQLTAEPLLLYLLLWTDYLGSRWLEAAENRNVVYRQIFRQIFKRDWGDASNRTSKNANRLKGGHIGTAGLSEEEFMRLQEALGLASWNTGGRTVSKAGFEKIVKHYITEDMLDDLKSNGGFSFKSVALQSYTTNSDSPHAGYEFVHKSIGEYLIARGLANSVMDGLKEVEPRISDDRCRRACLIIAQIAHSGIITDEIMRFLNDEVRLRFGDRKKCRDIIVRQYVPVLNWALRNMFPVAQIDHGNREPSFIYLDHSERRTMDVFWSFGQCLAEKAYDEASYRRPEIDGGWSAGPIKVDWPTGISLSQLVARLLDRSHVAESAHTATFQRLDLSNQVFTDASLGSVIFSEHISGYTPAKWIAFNAKGSLFARAAFYGCILRNARLDFCEFVDCDFGGGNLRGVFFSYSIFSSCKFYFADFERAILSNSDFRSCNFEHADFTGTKLNDVVMHDCYFGKTKKERRRRSRNQGGTIFDSCDMSRFHGAGLKFADTTFSAVKFDYADLSSCDFARSIVVNCTFKGAKINETMQPSVRASEEE